MHSAQFTLQDIGGTSLAILAFGVVLLPSGFLTGWMSNVLGFRRASLTEKLLLSLVLSVAVFPITVNLIGRWISLRVIGIFALALIAPCAILLRPELSRYRDPASWHLPRSTRIASWLAIAWVVVCVLSLVDLQVGHRLYATVASYDHCVRIPFVGSAIRRGAPLINPFYYVGGPATARYYYYWYVLCAVPGTLFGLMPRYLLFASSVWSGFALAAMIPLLLKHFFGDTVNLRRNSLLGITLLTVTGLDLIPVLLDFLARHRVDPDMEGWDPVQVTSWMDALIWVPHHVAAVVACLTGFLVLAVSLVSAGQRTRIAAAIVAALAFASGAGLSVYVAMVFAVFLPIWTSRLLLKRQLNNAVAFGISGFAAIILSLPYLRELAGAGTGGGGSARTQAASFVLGLRGFPQLNAVRAAGGSSGVAFAIAVMLFLYVIEFGFYGFIAARQLRLDFGRRDSLSEFEIAIWYIAIASLGVGTFVRSTVIGTNDLGIRSVMFAQFVFLLWGARALSSRLAALENRGGPLRPNLVIRDYVTAVLLALGISASLYQVFMLRAYPVFAEYGHIKERQAPASDGLSIRSAYEELSHRIPAGYVVQANPDSPVSQAIALYSNHQAVDAFAPTCGTEFGGSLARCQGVQEQIRELFGSPAMNWQTIDQLCDSLSINVLVVTRDDALWTKADSWAWRRDPVVTNRFVRALPCGPTSYPTAPRA